MKVKKDKVKIITLGCSKNLVDSEFIMAQIRSNDIEIVETEDKASTVIINTCGFIESAKQESINTILRAVERKKLGLLKNIYVAGCLSDRYMSELQKEIPEVDEFFGATDKIQTVTGILNALGLDYKSELLGERELLTPKHFAYLKISEGCDNPCSFCAIPIMRGGHKSKPLEQILKEARTLARSGVKELIIIGQDTTYWGFDKVTNSYLNGNARGRNLSMLINELSDIEGIEWIRIMYAYPSRFPMDVINSIKEHDNVCKYIDIPIQHISDKMLKLMRRGISQKKLIDLLEKIRSDVPGIAMRTTLIVGHPGETEKDFYQLLNFVKMFKFNRLGVFTYSHEEGTHAYSMKDNVPKKEKLLRQKLLLEVQREISLHYNIGQIGKTIKVIIDRKENDYYIGRTEHDAPEIDQEVSVRSKRNLNVGEFYQVKIYDCEEFDLFGIGK
ncbi:30S ribosomal protein S12 methylthiotransferase RimO [Ignavibacteria bacterium CHB1]|nr:MAG: 30S ribosomal protein S12 methylthiotransferase RimO [Chlorobiota bacterium]MCE7954013.1 30S ribosomal protein S12 methylthiotransferase RimO [Chlorobi bacterium CHB7]MDL1887911.1 30S ribosomal protein S12 methylthiotransferase RimO [Ignavibacteria bacterium CHB1]RIK47599.1 MAG: 30S ribosomal protein S12 methylthiotransferase RimO [Ignavibacteriota bacterium]